MGNSKFRLSDIMPNAWFYRLRDMGKTRRTSSLNPPKTRAQNPPSSPPLHPHYNSSPLNCKSSDTHFPEPTKKTKKPSKKHQKPKLVSSSVSANCSCKATIDTIQSSHFSPEFRRKSENFRHADLFSPESGDSTDIIIDMDDEFSRKCSPESFFDFPEMELPAILTKPAKFRDIKNRGIPEPEPFTEEQLEAPAKMELKLRRGDAIKDPQKVQSSLSLKITKDKSVKSYSREQKSPVRRSSLSNNGTGLKLRSNSPRILGSRGRIQRRPGQKRNPSGLSGVSESLAVVKASRDPQRDFKESMVEMILENDLRASAELEELLACYLSLNSDEYHDVIVKVFEQVWFEFTDIRL
ncbi:hypothetical protein AMTRI_Chr08g209130 [Amborella trichopoda]|uniref:Transcription repressor n=1 Tax=Amborella trichopoda TaxID=13333 RepID=W1PBR5_AMBTC|nr:transcription repressor OFP2 [Amborella trichopoda]ERN05383.1 hypothetical protein AMTR_s00007p00212750 [Amborella trichopoda]|eukprot:XP_006843708.1 transcription repressor OFP2 [Amborella trichopoda]